MMGLGLGGGGGGEGIIGEGFSPLAVWAVWLVCYGVLGGYGTGTQYRGMTEITGWSVGLSLWGGT